MAKIDMVAAKAKAYDGFVVFLQNERQKYIINNDYGIVDYLDCYIDMARCMLRSEVKRQESDVVDGKSANVDMVDIGKMQNDILTLLLSSRTKIKATEQLTVSDMLTIMDTLFYLVSRDPKVEN